MPNRTVYDLRREASRAPMLTQEAEREFARRAKEGDRKALQALVDSHMRLAISVAERYSRQGVPVEDLVGEASVGLVEAARRYDPDKGTRFGTYASWWVRAYVRRYCFANRRIVVGPSTRNARRIQWSLRRTERALTQSQGRAPTRDELAEALEASPEEIAMVESVLAGRDVPIGPVDEGPGFEAVANVPTPEEAAAEREIRLTSHRKLEEALARLTDREREIVRRRLLDDDASSLSVLGEDFGISRERIRQIQQRAETKLRTALLEVA